MSARTAIVTGASRGIGRATREPGAERGLVDGVQVSSILPGPVMTNRREKMLQRFAADRELPYGDAVATFVAETCVARFGTPQDIAEAITFPVSPQVRWMTGTTLRMDGGETKTN